MALRQACLMIGLSFITSACSEADAHELSASDPMHCAIAFEGYSVLAKAQGNQKLAAGLSARAAWQVEKAKAMPGFVKPPEAELTALAARYLALEDGGLALSTSCMKAQDADPDFGAWVKKG